MLIKKSQDLFVAKFQRNKMEVTKITQVPVKLQQPQAYLFSILVDFFSLIQSECKILFSEFSLPDSFSSIFISSSSFNEKGVGNSAFTPHWIPLTVDL